MKKTYAVLENASLPKLGQKEKMLGEILPECRKYEASKAAKALRFITVRPWRFAFGLSAAQTLVCTAIWGTGYTNFILRAFGG